MKYTTNITPGDWQYCEGISEFPVIATKNGITVTISDCYSATFEQQSVDGQVIISSTEALSNAKAIAAVPDMIQALIGIATGDLGPMSAKAALKKAGVTL